MSHNDKTMQEEKALQEALSPIVNELIDKNFENSGDKIASQMAPLIGGAIREQIKSQKDDIVDALYPVMGNMISKFVTKSLEELLNKINDQIQNGLSAQAIKRKIKAKIKGVSETELLLQESSHAKIKAALLIHKESGSLLCQVEDENASLTDADMLASMMSAIRSFVNEWVESNEKHQELGEIEYGGNKIIIEASGYSYLAVIIEGAAYTETYEKIRHALENIVLEFAEDIKEFNGNFENFPKEAIEANLQKELFTQEKTQEESKKSKKSPILWLLPLLLVGYLGYITYNDYRNEKYKTEILSQIEATPALSPFRIDIDVNDGVATLKGSVPFSYHKELLEKTLTQLHLPLKIDNALKVLPTLTDPMQVSANIAYLIKGFNINNASNVRYDFDYNTLKLSGEAKNKRAKEKLLAALSEIKGIKSIEDHIEIPKASFHERIYFDTADTTLNADAKEKLLQLVKTLHDTKSSAAIVIHAYSDMIGDEQKNAELAKKRVGAIQSFLQNNNITNTIQTEIYNHPPQGVDAKENPKEARSIEISLQEKESK